MALKPFGRKKLSDGRHNWIRGRGACLGRGLTSEGARRAHSGLENVVRGQRPLYKMLRGTGEFGATIGVKGAGWRCEVIGGQLS